MPLLQHTTPHASAAMRMYDIKHTEHWHIRRAALAPADLCPAAGTWKARFRETGKLDPLFRRHDAEAKAQFQRQYRASQNEEVVKGITLANAASYMMESTRAQLQQRVRRCPLVRTRALRQLCEAGSSCWRQCVAQVCVI